MTRFIHTASTEIAAEKLLAEARIYDPGAYMYRDHDDEGGHYVICYHWGNQQSEEDEDDGEERHDTANASGSAVAQGGGTARADREHPDDGR